MLSTAKHLSRTLNYLISVREKCFAVLSMTFFF